MEIRSVSYHLLGGIQETNLSNLPENYFLKYYLYHEACWPELSFVAVDTETGAVVGYVLAKLDEASEKEEQRIGHITSLSVNRSHRRMGVAHRLMAQSEKAMQEVYRAGAISLHVRVSNKAALHLYEESLKFTHDRTEVKYYADGEDAFCMKKVLPIPMD
ncbi:silencing group B protein [Ascobolus immersus RN42]|uniref:Silencing group B protein n=1 Tax=Ascobolus immersus RN42 TaxID=1160509 RepID=A0A3N4I8I1_ASCIM|nr:silencing group B protein [Ascobolus immersus RN42]